MSNTAFLNLLDDVSDFFKTGYRDTSRPVRLASDETTLTLDSLASTIQECRHCRLSQTRRVAVPGTGNPRPLVFIVGEAPGHDEDVAGQPFCGETGSYLDKWLEAINLKRSGNCFVTNIVKCRPPGNRDPFPDEARSCLGYLDSQLEVTQPAIILTLGRIPAQTLLKTDETLGSLRGRTFSYKGIPLLATWHPGAVLKNQDLKRPVWDDLKHLKQTLISMGHTL